MFKLVFKSGNEAETDSRRVAKVFGKDHGKVIRAIENLDCPQISQKPILACVMKLIRRPIISL